eukprot:CAMPEP_0117479912 /NCGR_PEP_ID=MMETSP0784-20121206/12126_1 /TAXON_ID=39447 /ORGANISM="" /LENGTH=158 /DNA_ID=CAMNT_0005274347 /DNA_START=748 /DNA_END=1224 /DNA_ORIENTATION=-
MMVQTERELRRTATVEAKNGEGQIKAGPITEHVDAEAPQSVAIFNEEVAFVKFTRRHRKLIVPENRDFVGGDYLMALQRIYRHLLQGSLGIHPGDAECGRAVPLGALRRRHGHGRVATGLALQVRRKKVAAQASGAVAVVRHIERHFCEPLGVPFGAA